MNTLREIRPAVLAAAPNVAAALTLAAGAMLLASGATPSEPVRFARLLEITPVILIEISHFVSSIFGLVLVLLAFGLRARLDAAWAATLAILALAAPNTLLKGFNWEETAALVVLALALAPLHAAFPRKARLSQMEITPGWLFSAFAVLVGVGVLGVWSFMNADYADRSWWRVLGEADASRAIRSSVGAAVALTAVGLWRLFSTPATPKVAGEGDPDFQRVRAILAKAEAAEPGSNLALLGDKRFLFSESGESFLMFGVRGRSWIALGAPTGRADEQADLMWRFREMAHAHAARPAFYGLAPDQLTIAIDLGFSLQKIGEAAAVPLEGFSLAGRRREVLRRNWRKAGEAGAAFEVAPREAVPALMDDLERISDAWLGMHAGGEKGFSMGGFEPRYVAEFPVAVVRVDGRIVAFATLWTTAGKAAFSMDLMRYGEEAPKNIMDYLFVELLLWGQAEGYTAFDFGMAPLAGLDDRPRAPILSRVGRLLYERGEEIYNFQGVRRYKDKYDPVWQPRYLAAPHTWQLGFVLADVGLLSSGGVAGLARRPRR
ncbi:MAG TPA: bifunctional lysylphosphatidylglycerol flippase/synthetase MprF [Phenylobacterium sp.]|nr:bifunctional lysylphosphatidylglycerol flippase/synthetase MprF [Phenylobacterium sp.]